MDQDNKTTFYKGKKVLVTGGAGFIGSNIISKLTDLGAEVTIGDNLSSGSINNVFRVWKERDISYTKTKYGYETDNKHKFVLVNFEELKDTVKVLKDHEIVFHLAANIGGRGYIDTHPADCCEGFSINQNVFKACQLTGVDRVQFSSSACVYPTELQSEYGSNYLLKEEDAFKNEWGNADKEYGWAKLMGEQMLKAYYEQYGLKGSSCRYVTAFGPWENDTHAIIALIRRAVEKKDPYLIWGTGKQDRDFTYVEDIVSGSLAACEHLTKGEAINLGTAKRYVIDDVVKMIFDILGWEPKEIFHDVSKPEGVVTRALDNKLAKELTGWEPKFSFKEGLEKTIEWFIDERPESVEIIK